MKGNVQYVIHIQGTCGSVRSQPIGTYWKLPRQWTSRLLGETATARKSSGLRVSCGPRARQDGTLNTCELQQASSLPMSQTTLTGSSQTGMRSAIPANCWDTRTEGPPVWMQELNHPRFHHRNMVNPPPRLIEAGLVARQTQEVSGRGCWRKQKPSRNRTDRGCNIIPLRKQADFQRVVRYERAGRNTEGGNRK